MIRQHHLTDLDELLLTVRNKNSAVYIQEAIIAYRTGAYRAAITSTWIAVCYDIVSKLRELAAQNDKNATQFIEKFDIQIQNKNTPKLQQIENSLLDKARNDFEFVSSHELIDLERLKEDRNLCAHPAYTGDELLFQPTPELVRSHVVHAILHLLQRQPVQGKSAIDSVCADLESRAFPQTQEDVFHFLSDRYLQRAKSAFIRNLEFVLLKKLFQDDPRYSERIIFSIQAIGRAHPDLYLEVIQEKISSIFEQLNDHNMGAIFLLLKADPGIWSKLQPAQRIKVSGLISSLHESDGMAIIRKYNPFSCIDILELQESLVGLFEGLSADNQIEVIESSPNKYFSDVGVEFYSNSNSYRNAEYFARTILLPIAPFLTPDQIKKIITATQENDQITYAGGIPEIIPDFFEITINHLNKTKQAWIDFIEARLAKSEPDHYAYPKLQALMQSNGLTWAVPQENNN